MALAAALAVLALLAAASPPAAAQIGEISLNGTKGYFYVYASGQIVVLDPERGAIQDIIRSSNATATPFPNKCAGNAFRGDWVDVGYGPGKRTVVATVQYSSPVEKRPKKFPDGVFTATVADASIPYFTALDVPPASPFFVPLTGKVWLTQQGTAGNTQSLRTLAPSTSDLVASMALPGAGPLATRTTSQTLQPGRLLHDINLNGQGYFTTGVAPGVYSLDFFYTGPSNIKRRGKAPPKAQVLNATFLSFNSLGTNAVKCPATGDAVYSKLLRMAFFVCTEPTASALSNKLSGGKAKLGIVQVDATTNTPVALMPFTGNRIFITPDESFLLVLNSASKEIYMWQLNVTSRSLVQWNTLTFPSGYTPIDIVFAVRSPYYVAYVSYSDADRIGILDFGRVLQCGTTCAPDNSASFNQDQQQMGFHNNPGPDDTYDGPEVPDVPRQTTRAVATGGDWVCQAAVYEQAVYCYSPVIGTPQKFSNISYPQHIVFVPETLTSYTKVQTRINPFFDCNNPYTAPAASGGDGPLDGTPGETSAAPAGLRPCFLMLSALYAAIALALLFSRV